MVAFATAAVVASGSSGVPSKAAAVATHGRMQDVPRSSWSRAVGSTEDATALASLQTPVVLTGSPVEEWVKGAGWGPHALQRHVPIVYNVYADRRSLFSYATKLEPLPDAAAPAAGRDGGGDGGGSSRRGLSTVHDLVEHLPRDGGTRLVNLTGGDFFACTAGRGGKLEGGDGGGGTEGGEDGASSSGCDGVNLYYSGSLEGLSAELAGR